MKLHDNDVVVVFSGGLDSTTLAYSILEQGNTVRAIYLNYGKPCSQREIKASKIICLRLGVGLEVVDLTGLGAIQKTFSPLGHEDPDELDIGIIGQKFTPSTSGRSDGLFVSGFHSLLSTGSYYAQVTGSSKLAVAAIKEQFEKIDDLEKVFEYFASSISLLNTKAGKFSVLYPFKDMYKADVVKEAVRLAVPIEITWSCVNGGALQCGACSQCVSRRKAFSSLMINDPTVYASQQQTGLDHVPSWSTWPPDWWPNEANMANMADSADADASI